MAASSPLSSWPPTLTPEQVAALSAQATDYALSHGIVYRPIGKPPSSTHAHHAPISLLPSPFPSTAFQTARSLQPMLNELYARVALDDAFLEKVIGGNVAKVDEFQNGLWDIYRQVRDERLEPDYHLGLFRSDYLLHSDPSSSSSTPSLPSIRQVEFNTISSSFGPLCAKVGQLHRHLLQQTGYYGASPSLQEDNLPQNGALQLLAAGLAEAHKTYIAQHGSSGSSPRILFVVQEQERNAFDQRWLEYELREKHGIRSVRRTFTSLIQDAHVEQGTAAAASSSSSSGGARRLKVQTETNPSSDPIEVSTIYYRSGYAPSDYTSPEHWSLRLQLERSSAIKCPTVALQLAGAKKVQQVLSEPGIVEQFLPHASKDQISQLKSTWAGLYPLDDTSDLGRQGLELAQNPTTAMSYVMKPQREGGGNNIYRADIPTALTAMSDRDAQRGDSGGGEGEDGQSKPSPKEREGYILMELIQPPPGLGNYLLRPPTTTTATESEASNTILSGSQSQHHEGLTTSECRLSPDVVSELGIYGVALFKRSGPGASLDVQTYYHQPQNAKQEDAPAYLLRTKGRESDEGGVAVGFSVLDSVLLV